MNVKWNNNGYYIKLIKSLKHACWPDILQGTAGTCQQKICSVSSVVEEICQGKNEPCGQFLSFTSRQCKAAALYDLSRRNVKISAKFSSAAFLANFQNKDYGPTEEELNAAHHQGSLLQLWSALVEVAEQNRSCTWTLTDPNMYGRDLLIMPIWDPHHQGLDSCQQRERDQDLLGFSSSAAAE